MCGIAGFTLPSGLGAGERRGRYGERLRTMVASLRHRGPDAQRAVLLDGVALGHARLSIIDLASGQQPMSDPASGVTVVFNGEIFNYLELRERSPYAFRTRSDTEVILAGYLAEGMDCVKRFIGQFAFALWDPRERCLWLCRDRAGVRPLFYAVTPEGLSFASEAKALFAGGFVWPELDARAIQETVHLWAPVSPHTMFAGVRSLPPGAVARWDGGRLHTARYWDLDLSDAVVDHELQPAAALAQLGEVLTDAVRLRLRADVPVAAYLSGGLDSSLICALAQQQLGGGLQTFSVGFEQARFDERGFQDQVAAALQTEHHSVLVGDRDIGVLLPEVVWHGEQVLLRTAPAPFLALSRLVREHQTKVVLTGEGADELFYGYDLYKETAVRQFWARQPASRARPQLFRRLYPYLPLSQQSPELLREFYGAGLDEPGAFDFSHRLRWSTSGRIARFFSRGFAERVRGHDPVAALRESLPPRVASWRPLARAQYLEMQTLLAGYLLSAQGDRMLMGNSVEGRFPFLDHRVIELAARLPLRFKLRGLDEKHLLKQFAAGKVPAAVAGRTKFPYRTPAAEAIVGAAAPAWSRTLLTRDAVDRAGVFDGAKVERLVAKLAAATAVPSEADAMALAAVATTQLLADQFVFSRRAPEPRHVREVELEVP